MALVVDTSATLASLDEANSEHDAVTGALASEPAPLVVSPMAAAEADHLLYPRLGAAARQFTADVAAEAYELREWAAGHHAAAVDVISRESV